MAKPSLYLFGKHSKRTPFAYQDYRLLFEKNFDYSDDPYRADIILTGFIKDFNENKELIHQIKVKNPSSQLVVISEEPLWDTIWTKNFTDKTVEITCCDQNYTVYQFNHYNSNLFEFTTYPYYLTTNNRFFSRYCCRFKQSAKYSEKEILKNWDSTLYKISFIAEKRLEDNYAKSYSQKNTWGLSKYRTDLAMKYMGQDSLIEGQNWQPMQTKRQDLPDWHLDKLTKLSKNSRFISAIENTFFKTYITEKMFDAYACQGIPLYVSGDDHGIRRIIKYNSWIDIYGLSPKEAFDKVRVFVPNLGFVQDYVKELNNLTIYFSDPHTYILERQQFAERCSRILSGLHD